MIGGPPRSGNDATESPSAEKERPAVIVLTVRREGDRTLVRVAPITHRPPADPGHAIEIPAVTKARLGLDSERSWIILDHANEFLWPGPDVRPVPGKEPATIYYGPLPPALFGKVKTQLAGLLRAGRLRAKLR